VRQVLGGIAEFEKTLLWSPSWRRRDDESAWRPVKRSRAVSLAGTNPEAVALAKRLARKKPKGGKLSLRAIAADLAVQGFLNERGKPFNPKSIAVMLAG
jgi:hypothetical protein